MLKVIRSSTRLGASAALRPARRQMSGKSKLFQEWEEEMKHAQSTYLTWKRISFFFALPATLLVGYKVYRDEEPHSDHDPKYGEYEHLHIRRKSFPWGDNTPFANPHVNYPYEKMHETADDDDDDAEFNEWAEMDARENSPIGQLFRKMAGSPEEHIRRRREYMAELEASVSKRKNWSYMYRPKPSLEELPSSIVPPPSAYDNKNHL